MEEHFVESHLGGYYFSSMDSEDIQEYCEECGDSDDVLFTYDDEDKGEPYNSLVYYFMKDLVLSRGKLEEKLYAYDAYERGLKEAIKDIKYDAVYNIDETKDIFKFLLDNKDIDQKTYNRLIKKFNKLLSKQFSFIDTFDYSQIDLKEYENKIKKRKK